MNTPVITPRYFVCINNEVVCEGGHPKAFVSDNAAGEYAWDNIRRGEPVFTFSDRDTHVTEWTPDENCIAIVGIRVDKRI